MTVATFQPPSSGGGAGLDTFLDAGNTATNYGTGTTFYVGTIGKTPKAMNSIIEIDVSTIPSYAIVSAATLTMYANNAASSAFQCEVNQIRRTDWSETQATWTVYKTANNWGTAGAMNTSSDMDTTYNVNFNAPTSTGSFVISALHLMVQDAVSIQSGIFRAILFPTNQTQAANYFVARSAEHATAADRPLLTVTYTARRIFTS